MTSPSVVRRTAGVGTPAAAAASWNAAPSRIPASSSAAISSTTLTAQLPSSVSSRQIAPSRPRATGSSDRRPSRPSPNAARIAGRLVAGTGHGGSAGSLRDQPLVPDPVRLVGGGAELLVAERLVVAEVALEPADLAVALEGEDVGRDPVEEPAVVADDDGAAGERLEARPRAPAACRRRGRWSARRAAGRCRPTGAAWPGGRGCARRRTAAPTSFCWSVPRKLKLET